jgi:predicted TIM-barrel fold metal-dependent hydrolase
MLEAHLPVSDCHLHVVDPVRFPFPESDGYRPAANERGAAGRLRVTLAAHQVTHGLLVQPSAYGDDNTAMLDAIAAADGLLKGIAVVRPDASDRHLETLRASGVVGISINVAARGQAAFGAGQTESFLRRIRELDWYVELQYSASSFPLFAPSLRAAGVKVIFPHFGRPHPELTVDEPGFQQVLQFGREGRGLLKLSGAFRISKVPYPFIDIDPFAEAALNAFGIDCCVWGSDWPFLDSSKSGYGAVQSLLKRWHPDADDQRTVLWNTPQRAFGFPNWQANERTGRHLQNRSIIDHLRKDSVNV